MVGLLPGEHGAVEILLGYVVLIIVMFVVMMVLSAKPYPRSDAPDIDIGEP